MARNLTKKRGCTITEPGTWTPKSPCGWGVDPLMEKYTNVSGYVFCHSNPIVRIDRDGCADYFSISGKFIRSDKSKIKYLHKNFFW